MIGIGDGTQTDVPAAQDSMAPIYAPYQRPIAKPVAGSRARRGRRRGADRGHGVHVRRDDRRRDVSVRSCAGVRRCSCTAGFLFDVPVRFDTDYLEVDLSAFAAGSMPHIPLVEIKL